MLLGRGRALWNLCAESGTPARKKRACTQHCGGKKNRRARPPSDPRTPLSTRGIPGGLPLSARERVSTARSYFPQAAGSHRSPPDTARKRRCSVAIPNVAVCPVTSTPAIEGPATKSGCWVDQGGTDDLALEGSGCPGFGQGCRRAGGMFPPRSAERLQVRGVIRCSPPWSRQGRDTGRRGRLPAGAGPVAWVDAKT